MQRKVLVIEDSSKSLQVVSKLVAKAGLQAEGASSLTEAKARFSASMPEDYLCAVVAYSLPDAPRGEAIDFTIDAFIPTIVVTDQTDPEVRESILSRDIVDYLVKENHQVYDFLSRLLARLDKNKSLGVLVADYKRSRRRDMVALLRRHNFLVYEAKDQDAAQQVLAEHPHIRLLLVDESLDDKKGIHFTAELRRAYAKEELAIVGITAKQSGTSTASFLKSGANDVLQSPFYHEEFLVRVMQNLELLESVETIRRVANSDYLTGLPNRRHFFHTVTTRYRQLPRSQSLALIDLDHFKKVNDTWGHDAGDAVLKTVADLIGTLFADVPVARFGGEEFCIYLPDIPHGQAKRRIMAFREQIEDTPILFKDSLLEVTASIGLVSNDSMTLDNLLSEADKLLYQAKSQGRNQVCDRAD
ncbi:diguanylate cyclase [Aestuariibacter sp. A3R04]|uniref:GGDEF domain-containing response regulator n=1 Tax=Aestuariibacter sp. A3R04 TaxID=2841571 RepID=UPI001C0942BF|nr:diguanylate cyclase [Aestuariibacter sp. A3R04]MBU3023679.1 diguanylate cyclase [Aestuariibacter sp. A3R04]